MLINSPDSYSSNLLVKTEDGSLTLQDPECSELYHNKAGAYSEALLNYVTASGAIEKLNLNKEIRVLDVCFGLGYNSFVLLQEALRRAMQGTLSGSLSICSVESNQDILQYLPAILGSESFRLLAEYLNPHKFMENKRAFIKTASLEISLDLAIEALETWLPLQSSAADFVFHDPFSPKRMPELWTVDIFAHYFRLLTERQGAILTYSSAAAVRGGLIEVGFSVQRTQALGGKSGGSIGFSKNDSAGSLSFPLSQEEQDKVLSRSGVPYRSWGFSLGRQEILALRHAEQWASSR